MNKRRLLTMALALALSAAILAGCGSGPAEDAAQQDGGTVSTEAAEPAGESGADTDDAEEQAAAPESESASDEQDTAQPDAAPESGGASDEQDAVQQNAAPENGGASDEQDAVQQNAAPESGGTSDSQTAVQQNNTAAEEAAAAESYVIGDDAAKAVALFRTGYEESEVRDLSAKLNEADGVLIYEVAFKADGAAYRFTIDASSGEILSREVSD